MTLLDKIRQISYQAARELEGAGFRTDLEIRSLDRTDICELFSGKKNLKLRKDIIEVIHPKRPVDDLVRQLKDFIPQECVRARGSVLADYLSVLKDLKTQMDSVQNFLTAHISLLEELSNDRPPRRAEALPENDLVTSGLVTCNKNSVHRFALGNQVTHPSKDLQGLCGSERRQAEYRGHSSVLLPELKEVKYNMIVSGKTNNAHQQLIEEVMNNDQVSSYQFSYSNKGHQVTLLFRPIVSRVASDAEAAMSEINDDKPVILVLMHHNLEPTSSLRSWNDHPNVVLQVHVFFHETKSGLLTCKENSFAISAVRNKLLEYSTLIIPEENPKHDWGERKEAESWDDKQDIYDWKQKSEKKVKVGSFWPFTS